MGRLDVVKRIWHKEVCVLRIGLMHVYHSIDFHYLLSFVIHVLLLDKLVDLLIHFSLSVMCCISAELPHVCQIVGVCIGKWRPNQATTDNAASHTGYTEIGSSHEI